jgi:cardiolipin synthase
MPPWFVNLSGWLYALIVLACVLIALLRKREPSRALAWSLAIVFLPILGPILFVVFGNNRVNRHLARKVAHKDIFTGQRAAEAGDSHAPLREAFAVPHEGRWAGITRLLEDLGQGPCRSGNATELFDDGATAFAAMAEAMRGARHHIHVEFYIFRDDELGQRAIDLMCEKARAGIEVRLLLDAVGSIGGYRLQRRLRRAGGKVGSFLSLLHISKLVSPNLRNHRKLVIVDGEVAFFGGLNVGREYLGRRVRRNPGRPWFDLHMRIAGPAVWDLQWMFLEDWDYSTGEAVAGPQYFPLMESQGEVHAQVLAGGPDQRPNPIRFAFLAAIGRAQTTITIATPYLVPDLALRDALELAARSGVSVRILTQHPPPDQWLAFLCGLYYIADLTGSGVKVLGYVTGMMHAKAIVVDRRWAMLGTANLDNRSMFLNFEQMTVFDEGAVPAEIDARLEAVIATSKLLDVEWLANRPLVQRLGCQFARLLAPLL